VHEAGSGEHPKIKVLFVDDDAPLLAGLRRMLYSKRSAWEMTFSGTAAEALAELEKSEYDVIVSDMRMPGMDGASLLAEVRRRFPRTVRIILSGQSDAEAMLRSVSVAHQFLSKPCDRETLCEAIEGCLELQLRLSDGSLRDLLGKVDVLPSPPRVIKLLNDALDQPSVSLEQIATVVEPDPAITAKLLQLVNSPFFGVPSQVTNVQQALNYLGLNGFRNLLTATEMVRVMPSASSIPEGVIQRLETNSLNVAMRARALTTGNAQESNDAFAAGMLHDAGLLAAASCMPEKFMQLFEAMDTTADLFQLEIEIFGASHADLGAYLLALWGLPNPIVDAVARHHEPVSVKGDAPALRSAVQRATAEFDMELWAALV
jgi:HD-like signal output (HDOD) protein/ActR/RegA family two-component response regulator